MVTIQAVLIFFIPEKMTEHPSPAESAGIFKFDFLLLLKGNVNKNNIIWLKIDRIMKMNDNSKLQVVM